MKRMLFSILLLFGSAGASQPDVLFIAIDDLNCRLGCYGFDHIKSPNIDELAGKGVRFDRAYCQYPSCGPSRASVLSGLRPDTTGIISNRINFREHLPGALTLPQHFRNNGYHVARVGKIFHQDNPTHIGTDGPDDPESWDETVNPRGRDKDEEDQLTVYTPQLPLPDQMCFLKAEGTDGEQTDGKVTTEAIRLLRESREKPLFLGVGYYRPHIPYIAPQKYFDFYSLEKTPLPGIPADYRSFVPAAALASTPEWPNFGTTEREARECIVAYDACVSFVDAQVGRLLDFLEKSGRMKNTIIVLWGDHGYHLGEHGLWRKNSLFEESCRAPLIVAGAGVKPHSSGCEKVVEFVDIFPTVTQLAGLAIPDHLDGVSLVPLLDAPESEWDRPAFSQVQFREVAGRSVRTGQWRYVQWGPDGAQGEELYDQEKDPLEMNNLAEDIEKSEVINRLKTTLRNNWPD